MAVIGGFRSDLSIARILETFPRVFCFPKSRINENGGKLIMKPFEFRELMRENLHGTIYEALKEITTDMREFFKYTAVISILRIAHLSY